MSDSLWPYGLQPTRLLCPWDSPGKNTGVGCHALLQGIFLTEGSNLPLLCLLHWHTWFSKTNGLLLKSKEYKELPVKWGVALIVNKRVWITVFGCNLKNDRIISVHFQGKPFNITVIQVWAPTTNAKEAEQFYDDLQDLLELTPKKRRPFHHRGLECISRKSRDTWNNRQVWPWGTKWSKTKANRVLPRECTGYSKHLLPTIQEVTTLHMDITRWL